MVVVDDVDLSKPGVGQKAVETTNASVGEKELVGIGIDPHLAPWPNPGII